MKDLSKLRWQKRRIETVLERTGWRWNSTLSLQLDAIQNEIEMASDVTKRPAA